MKTLIIVQARLNSSRFANKVLKKINKKTIIEIIFKRLQKVKNADEIVFSIPQNKREKKLKRILTKNNAKVFLGKEKDVLDRYYKTAKSYKATTIVRITADCPLVDSQLIDEMIAFYKKNNYEYLSNTIKPTYPDGIDIEIFQQKILEQAWKKAKKKSHREHVTKYILENSKFKKFNFKNKIDYSYLRWTIDEPIDYEVIKKIYNNFKPNIYFSWKKAIKFCLENKEILVNNHLLRNYKKKITTGQKMWGRAQLSIAGGNSMISKHPYTFLPKLWPTYFKKTKGCQVWDLDGKKYYDLSLMGCGTNILGYSNSDVDKSVMKIVKAGNLSTLNCVEEVLLAEKLISINSWAQKALFARTGAEANSIAIRLARAYTGKDKVAICGYHGWHDWYLSASRKDEKIIREKHLPFYSTVGVPKSLKNSLVNFEYNNFEQLENLINNDKNIGTIKMEVVRNIQPKNNFLKKIRNLANKYNKVLIFDETTTGFRETFGGIHKKFNVYPDIAIYGKSLGNGYPITSVVGKEEIMNCKDATFMSSTFWTDRIGPTAALKTLEIMEKFKSWEKITKTGSMISKRWKSIGKKFNLPIKIYGIPALCNFIFESKKNNEYKTYITQKMLESGFLANNIIYSSISHKSEILNKYFEILEKIFGKIRDCEDGDDIKKYINGPLIEKTFRKII